MPLILEKVKIVNRYIFMSLVLFQAKASLWKNWVLITAKKILTQRYPGQNWVP